MRELEVGERMLYEGRPHVVVRVTPCAAYLRPEGEGRERVTIPARLAVRNGDLVEVRPERTLEAAPRAPAVAVSARAFLERLP